MRKNLMKKPYIALLVIVFGVGIALYVNASMQKEGFNVENAKKNGRVAVVYLNLLAAQKHLEIAKNIVPNIVDKKFTSVMKTNVSKNITDSNSSIGAAFTEINKIYSPPDIKVKPCPDVSIDEIPVKK